LKFLDLIKCKENKLQSRSEKKKPIWHSNYLLKIKATKYCECGNAERKEKSVRTAVIINGKKV
jgi:hypothetical protein